MGNGHVKLVGEILAETIIEEERRAKICLAKIQMILKKYDCIMEPILHIRQQGVMGEVQIIASPMIKTKGINHG